MAISKVVFGDNSLIDLTNDTVSSNTLLSGVTAHGADGEVVTGSIIVPEAATELPEDLGISSVGSSTKYAREDHVHTKPSAFDIGAVSTSDVQYKIYDSVEDLGLTTGSATIVGAWNAMPDGSILICSRGNFPNSELPGNYAGEVEIIKNINGVAGKIEFHGKVDSISDYRMFLNSSNVPTGTWVGELKTKTITVSGTATANSQLDLAVNWGLPTGAEVVGWFIQRISGGAVTREITFCNFISSTTIRVVSTHSPSQNVTVVVTCLYR